MKVKPFNDDRYEDLLHRQAELIRNAPPEFFQLSDQDLSELIAKGTLNPLPDRQDNNRHHQFFPSSP